MKILIVGSGGREHAIAWKIAQNEKVEKIYVAPGNGGTEIEDKCENLNISEIDKLADFARENEIALTIVGPEVPLVQGIVDEFKKRDLKIFGPSKEAAQLEGSKTFAKEFAEKYGIKSAEYKVFTDRKKAIEHVQRSQYPLVVKADGLAAGKGVIICESEKEAVEAIDGLMVLDMFQGAGLKIVIEEFLEGVEASILSITDGKTIIPFISSKDHKQIFDGDKGPNTGGMGVVAPNFYCDDDVLKAFEEDLMKATLVGIKEEKMDFVGTIFFGLMITKKGVYLLEYNVRMGDPETQAVLSLMESDYLDLMMKAVEGELETCEVKWKEQHACCVNGVSKGYPGAYEKGYEISGIDQVDSKVFICGAKYDDGKLKTSGGRVLSVVALGDSIEEAREKAYRDLETIHFDGMYYRKDIGQKR